MSRSVDATVEVERAPTDKERRLVALLAAYGIPEEQIAKAQGMSRPTLRRLFDKELADGNLRANTKVAESLYQAATSGNVQAQIWWSKARMGWKDSAHGGGGDDSDARWPKLIIEIRDPTRSEPVIEGSERPLPPAIAPASLGNSAK